MSESAEPALGIDAHRALLPYGMGGDYIGARRTRRAFRLTVLAFMATAVSLYFAEHYLRYDLSEVQYRMALTLEDDSQRAILRNVVERDERESEVPTAKYVAALACIEEDDLVLERFAEAVSLAPDDTALQILYGCKLFQMGEYREARRVFREASLKAPKNALPRYLQAASVAATSSSEEDFRTALAMIARTNDSGDALTFPQPVWHESLPRHGYWYAERREEVATAVCAPLYTLKNTVLSRVRSELRESTNPGMENWLYQLQVLGKRLVGDIAKSNESLCTGVLIAGIKFQTDAIELRQEMAASKNVVEDPALVGYTSRLQEALSQIVLFEGARVQHVKQGKSRALVPVYLAVSGAILLGVVSVVFILLNRVFKSDHNARAVRQRPVALRITGVWLLALFLVLLSTVVLPVDMGGHQIFWCLWLLLLGAMASIAAVYPAFVLPSETVVCQSYLADPGYKDLLVKARGARRRAYVSLGGRYANIALGGYISLMSFSLIAYRVITGLYPTDMKLHVSGLTHQEMDLIAAVQTMLQ